MIQKKLSKKVVSNRVNKVMAQILSVEKTLYMIEFCSDMSDWGVELYETNIALKKAKIQIKKLQKM